MIVVTGTEGAGDVGAGDVAATDVLAIGLLAGAVVAGMLAELDPLDTGDTAVLLGAEATDTGVVTVVEIATEVVRTVVLRAGQFVTSGPQLVTVISSVEYKVIVDGTAGAGDDTGDTKELGAEATDTGVVTVVEIATEDVTTVVLRAGQFVTSGPQLVMVISSVEYNVMVDGTTGAGEDTGDTKELEAEAKVEVEGAAAGVTVEGQAVMMAGF